MGERAAHFIRQKADRGKLAGLSEDPEVLASEFVPGPSFGVHGMVLGDETLVSAPSLQLVGIPECDGRERPTAETISARSKAS